MRIAIAIVLTFIILCLAEGYRQTQRREYE